MRFACFFPSLSKTPPCLPAGGGRLEVRGDGHRQDLPLGFCDGVRAGNSGTLPPATHRLHEMKKRRAGWFLFGSGFPPAALTRQTLRRLPPSLSRLTVSSPCLCLLVFGTPSSSITSPLQLSLASLDLARFARVSLPCYCARNPFSSSRFFYMTDVMTIITSALLCLSTFFSLPVHRALTFWFMLYSFFLHVFFFFCQPIMSILLWIFIVTFLPKCPLSR